MQPIKRQQYVCQAIFSQTLKARKSAMSSPYMRSQRRRSRRGARSLINRRPGPLCTGALARADRCRLDQFV